MMAHDAQNENSGVGVDEVRMLENLVPRIGAEVFRDTIGGDHDHGKT